MELPICLSRVGARARTAGGAGVIVSHIIVLSDSIEEARAEGRNLEQALVQAGLRWIR